MAVVTVVPAAVDARRRWREVDAEYGEYARQVGEEAERQAREYLDRHHASRCDVTYRTATGRSVSSRAGRRRPRGRRHHARDRVVGGRARRAAIVDRVDGRQAPALLPDPAGHQPARLPFRRRRRVHPADLRLLRQPVVGAHVSGASHELAKRARRAAAGGELRRPRTRRCTRPRSASRPRTRCSTRGRRRPPRRSGSSSPDGDHRRARPTCVIGTGTGWVESVSSIDWQRDELLADRVVGHGADRARVPGVAGGQADPGLAGAGGRAARLTS